MFVDTAKVFVSAGKGGNGAVSFRREIYVDKGGPDGGNGGRGGDVVFQASNNVNTLLDFRYKPELKAFPGKNGAKRDRAGRSGEDKIVRVPVGTVVKKDSRIIADFTEDGQEVIVARGGDGGFGNAHFKSSVRQTPNMAELGEDGDTFDAELELKLLADVGLVGFPNAGKSTFLSVVSNARPEIADYAFTTLTPNLGVADIDDGSLLIADIPGLIEGASDGKGLGDDFLRHIERTSVLLHLIDAYSNDIAESYKIIRHELESYSADLVERPEVIALTKIDGLDQDILDLQIETLKTVAPKSAKIFSISAPAHRGTIDLLRELRHIVQNERKKTNEKLEAETEHPDDLPIISLNEAEKSDAWSVEKQANGEYEVYGEKIEKFARRTNFDQFENVNRLRDIMKKMGIYHELVRQGAVGESVVNIGQSTFTLTEQ